MTSLFLDLLEIPVITGLEGLLTEGAGVTAGFGVPEGSGDTAGVAVGFGVAVGIGVAVGFGAAVVGTGAAVGFGAITAQKIIARMLIEYRKEHKEEPIEEKIEELSTNKRRTPKPSDSGIIVKGIDNCLVKLSKCCDPLPGDEIIGYITKGRGVSVHRKDCVNVNELLKEENRIIDVKWFDQEKVTYTVEIEIFANDRNGLLADIIQKINEAKAKILGVNARATKERIAVTEVTLEVDNLDGLNKIIRELRKIDSVYEVKRKK